MRMRTARDWCDMLMRILEGTPRDPALRSHHASAVVYRNSLVGRYKV